MSGHCRDLVGSAIWGKPPRTREEVGCFDSLRGLKKALRLGSIMKLACSAGWARRGAAHRRGRSATQAHSVQDRFSTQQGRHQWRMQALTRRAHPPQTRDTNNALHPHQVGPAAASAARNTGRLRALHSTKTVWYSAVLSPAYRLHPVLCRISFQFARAARAPSDGAGSAGKRAIRQTTPWVVLAPTLPQSSNLTLNTRSYAGGRIHSCENDDDLPLSECVIIV